MILSKLENFDFNASLTIECDLLVVCSGYESRCSDVIKSGKIIAGTTMIGSLSADSSYIDLGDIVSPQFFPSMDELLDAVNAFLEDSSSSTKVVLDISCLDPYYMAGILDSITRAASVANVELLALYSIASYSPPLLDQIANESIEPVHVSFAGWSTPESRPTSLILGLGYEPYKAEGASEFFEPSDQWIFLPRSPVSEFYQVVKENNRSLLEKAEGARLIEYNVDDPETTYGQIEIVISILLRESNPVLLPFGPKIFFFLCLVHCLRHPELGVWRVSKGKNSNTVDITSSGVLVGVRCIFATE